MLFHSLREPALGVDIEQIVVRLPEPLDVPVLRGAWEKVVQRHEILRVGFRWEGLTTPIQVVERLVRLPFAEHDWRGLSPAQRETQLRAFLREDRRGGFVMDRAPLFRLTLFRYEETDYRLVWTLHHALLDGRSFPLVLQEVFIFYRAGAVGDEPDLPPPRPYRDYIRWQQTLNPESGEIYWRNMLAGFHGSGPVVTGHVAGAPDGEAELEGDRETRLSADLTASLEGLAEENGLTLNTLVQGAWALLLSRYTGGETDIVFGATRACRRSSIAGAEAMIGLFINTLPVRVRVEPGAALFPWLKELRAQWVAMREYEQTPLVKVQTWSEVPADQPLFDSLLVFENYALNARLRAFGGEWAGREVVLYEKTNYPLTLAAYAGPELILRIGFHRDRYSEAIIERMLDHLCTLLEGMRARPACLGGLPLLTRREREQLLPAENQTCRDYPADRCLHQLFEEQVERTPDAVAVSYEGRSLTYRELNRRANQLAHYLRDQGVSADVLVGLFLERSLELVVGLLGILKAGGAYLPVDLAYPPERVAFMLEDARVPILLTQTSLLPGLPGITAKVLSLDSQWQGAIREDESNPESGTQPDNLAYVIYTSGSTGKPKGTLVTHANVARLFTATEPWFGFGPADRWTLFHSIAFDFSVWELWGALLYGGRCVIVPYLVSRAPEAFHELLCREQITVLNQTPSAFRQLMRADLTAAGESALRLVVFGGEALELQSLRTWWERHGDQRPRLVNMYGITETTVHATYRPLAWNDLGGGSVIGRPLPDLRVYVLDAHMQPVPMEVPGEIYVGGAGVTRGYWNHPELTAARFVPDPFSARPGARLYRSGDLGRYRVNGELEYLGRADHQVKLRGFRIELGEIEAVLAQHPNVRETLVVAQADWDGEPGLVGYFVARQEPPPAATELRSYIKAKLPDYMVPASFVSLKAFPLTAHGKVDRRALPAPQRAPASAGAGFRGPRNGVEAQLAELWAEVLGLTRVGVNDNFFALGGHSLRAMQLVGRLRLKLGVDLPIREVFEHPTLQDLARELESRLQPRPGAATQPVHPGVRPAELPLSYGQQRLWFLDQLEPASAAYNIAIAMRLAGSLQPAVLEQSVREIVQRHESLRTVLVEEQGKPIQRVLATQPVPLPVVSLEAVPESERELQARQLAALQAARPFDLARGPLLRTILFRLGAHDHLFLLVVHHAVFDGRSVSVFLRELAQGYSAWLQGSRPSLPPLPWQYADYALWQRAWLEGEVLSGHLAYWRRQLANAPAFLDLPTDYPRPEVQSYRGAAVPVTVASSVTTALTRLAHEEGCTLFMMLLAAFQALLHRYSGQEDLCVGCPEAGRNRPELEGLIGFFVNTLVIRSTVTGRQTFRDLLRHVREAALGAFAHVDLPFEKLVEDLRPERSLGRTPLFQVLFDLQTGEPTRLELDNVKAEPITLPSGVAKFDLSLALTLCGEDLTGELEYNRDLFAEGTMLRMRDHLLSLLDSLRSNPDQPVATLALLGDAERLEVLEAGCGARVPCPAARGIHELFELQAAQSPDVIAVACGGRSLTYRELSRQSSQLARHLGGLGAGPDTIVGICAEPSLEMVVGLLAILKAGSAYLPLEPDYPRERLSLMLEDSGAIALLSQRRLQNRLPSFRGPVCWLDDLNDVTSREAGGTFVGGADPASLCYVIYTSGSTGQPKGVMIPHRALVNHSVAMARMFSLSGQDRVLQFASISFDVAAEELFPTLLSGATVVLAPGVGRLTLADFDNLLAEAQVTVANLPTPFWQEWAAALSAGDAHLPPSLRLVVVGSESVAPAPLRHWLQRVPDRVGWLNAYGPTEATITTTVYQPRNGWQRLVGHAVPIGRPIANTQLYVLDESLEPVPPGVPGELYIGGEGLARGYLGRPELTAEKFIPHPFPSGPGARLYRTGDRVRFLQDGNLEFLGRSDQQVKLRGFRIEPGEIEAALMRHPAVRLAVVTLSEGHDGQKRLIAHVVPHSSQNGPTDGRTPLDPQELRGFLQTRLPAYMIPAGIAVRESLPMLPNGKVDRRALPATTVADQAVPAAFVAPQTPAEEQLARIWSAVLGRERIGTQDNFFDLGGHSLLATQIMSRVCRTLGVSLPLQSIFEAPTVAALAARIETVRRAEQHPQPKPVGTAEPREWGEI